jgi:hypothetical protein
MLLCGIQKSPQKKTSVISKLAVHITESRTQVSWPAFGAPGTLPLRVIRPLSECRDAIEPLNSGLEECLGLLRKCATIGVVEKMFDKGETKGNLEAALKRLNSAFQLFSMWLNVTKSASLPKSDATPAPSQELADKARSVVEMRDTAVAKGAGEQSTLNASQSVEKRPSPSQVYPDLL